MLIPKRLVLHKQRAELELLYHSESIHLSAEYLRVHSPSAEVQGHSPEQKRLPLDKQDVTILAIEKQGRYAIKLIFSDGHDSGIYTWDYLYTLAHEHDTLWKRYLNEAEAKQNEKSGTQVVKWIE